jgi:hypothetical protein
MAATRLGDRSAALVATNPKGATEAATEAAWMVEGFNRRASE